MPRSRGFVSKSASVTWSTPSAEAYGSLMCRPPYGNCSSLIDTLKKSGLKRDDIDLVEINEAFASVVLAWQKETGWDLEKVNVNGGSVALGHPIGASGCRLLVTLLHEMVRRNKKTGLVSLCLGGGEAVALIVKR